MTDNTFECPHCDEPIEITAALEGPIRAAVSADYNEKLRAKAGEVEAAKAREAQAKQDAAEKLAELERKSERDLSELKVKLVKDAEASAKLKMQSDMDDKLRMIATLQETLKSRDDVLSLLGDLPTGVTATNSEVRHLIQERQLYGRGVGVVDVHLVACCLMTSGTSLWTGDKRLNAVAADLKIPLVQIPN